MDTDVLNLLHSLDARLADLNDTLKPLAAYAAYLHQQAAGLKEVHVTSYVRGKNAGGELVHLYTDHPKVTKRVGRVYAEHFKDLPFDPQRGKLHEGEQAPSRDWAAANGYLNPVTPFDAVFAPTGKTTDGGLPIFAFSHVLAHPAPLAPAAAADLDTPWCEWCGDRPALPGIPCDRCAKLGAKPGDGAQVKAIGNGKKTATTAPAQAQPVAASAAQTARPPSQHDCPNCGGDWRYYSADCKAHVQPDGEAAPVIARAKALDPASLRIWLRNEAYRHGAHKCSQRQRADLSGAWKVLIADDARRVKAKKALTGYESTGDMPDALVLALHGWLRPAGSKDEIHLTDSLAGDEIALLMDLLR